MGDKIKFVLNTSSEYFNATASKEDNSFIDEFFRNPDIQILGATANHGKISFHHKIPTDQVCLLFYKIPQGNGIHSVPKEIGSNDTTIGMLTLEGGMIKSMYNSVSRVFSAGSKHNEYSPEITVLLENLQTSLNSQLGLPQSGITCVLDEIHFWNQKSLNSPTKQDREQAQEFVRILEKINKQLNKVDHHSLQTIEEFLDSSHNNLDEIWRLPYHFPQNRMCDLMDIICNYLIDMCIDSLETENIWNLSSLHVNNLMSHAIDLMDSWMQLCDSLTRFFWPNYSQHQWIGKPCTPKRGELFKERLNEIKNIKKLFKQVITLLNSHDIREMFNFNSPFKSINIFDTSPGGHMKWNKALNQFEQMLQPIDERTALAIKSQLQNHLSNPRQVMFTFSKYDTLIQRPTVLELLTIEREQFLQSLTILLQDLKKAMKDTNMEPDTGYLSTICNECRWLKVVEYQIMEIEKVSHLITGREGFTQITQSIQEIKEEVQTLLRTNFEIWSEQNLSAIRSGDLKLREDQNVVEFEREGRQLMRVTFNPKLITFCHDIREFENLGYRVSSELRSIANHTGKFMSYARRLQQIATFHNTIGDRMIPCQRPIMLQNAIELSKLVKSESVAWNDEESVQRYVTVLQKAVSKLSADNSLLVGYHEQAKRTIIKLMNTDLLSQGQTWKDEMRHLRELVANLERQGYKNLATFNLHWDYQLYKVLEYQYVLGLIDMNNKLPDIRIDIVFRQRQLQFRPPEEEIRAKYFTQLRRFIERPSSFHGLSESSNELFKLMVERNRHHFISLFRKADELFEKIEELKKLWIPWVALGCVDIEELCGVHLQKWEDWDANFKACKYFSQQIAKLQNVEETIDCFVINVLPLRSDIEFINRRYWEILASSLKISILNDITLLQEFLQSSLQFLRNVPTDDATIAESGTKYEKIRSDLPKMTQLLDSVKGKNTCLSGWCKERVSSLSSILDQWDKLHPLIENHSVILQRQIDIMKDHVKTEIFNLKNEVEKFMLRWESTVNELENNENPTNLQLFKERKENWSLLVSEIESARNNCEKFNLEFPEEILELFKETENAFNLKSKQWEIYENFLNEMDEVGREEWTIYRRRPYILTEFLQKWGGSVNSSLDIPSSRIRQMVQRLQDVSPILQNLQSDSLTERHWARILQLLNLEIKPIHSILLKDILDGITALEGSSSEIQSIVRKASSEQIVRQALNELDQWAVTSQFKLISHKDAIGNQISLVKDYQEVLNKIGDNQSLLQSAKNSAAFDAFSDQAELWETRLNNLEIVLLSLSQSQRKWIYLEPVFSTGTLKSEEAIFRRLDKDFRYIMRELHNDPKVLSIIKISNITAIIKSLENQLSRCQNTLLSYIMEKRNIFPRFYFLGDDDLLELLGQASKDEIIQKHIKKLFPGIHKLGIERNDLHDTVSIVNIQSSEGDIVKLNQSVQITNIIEKWLSELIVSIHSTLQNQIYDCSQGSDISEQAIRIYPIQVVCTARAIIFTKQVEKAITSMSMMNNLNLLNQEIKMFSQLKNVVTENLMQLKLKAFLLDLVHYKNVIEILIANNVTNTSDWNWLQQIKFYIDNNKKVILKMVYAQFEYSYEFLGNANKLVYTSLTHKCYLTLTQAICLGLGGNPFGPAGTGKTETVKALGNMMGRLVLVFNCDENVDTEAMNLILTGLALCGAWGCFDEFNRLKEQTLSAISMLIQPIQTSLKEKSNQVQIMNKTINLNQHCGIFVTLNPAGEGYGGRQQLPGNIQALFRPIVMQQPEPTEIARILLFVEGFQYADEIAKRIVELFNLTLETLSSEKHYDWGLRELKTVLEACGKEKLNNSQNLVDELSILVQVLRTNTMSKLTLADSKSFDMLLNCVFPEVDVKNPFDSQIKSNIEEAFKILELCPNENQMKKVLQLFGQVTKRMGVVVVGPPKSGKTTIIALLKKSLINFGQHIKTYIIGPKSMNRIQLLGKLDPDTRQWNDGVLTQIAVTVNSEPKNIQSWIICDGDIDPEWIEALNSVLDDNKLLTLPSGWRIQLGNNVNFIFETHSLVNASPATISRMGIINLNSEDLDPNLLIENFLKHQEYSDILKSYFDEYLPKALNLLKKEVQCNFNEIKISLIESIIQNVSESVSKEQFCSKLIQAILNYVPLENQNDFAARLYDIFDIYISDLSKADLAYYNDVKNVIEFYETDSNEISELMQTSHIKMYMELLRNYLKSYRPFILVGSSGSGKTLLIKQVSSEFSGYQLIIINCNKQLTPNYILQILKQHSLIVSGARGRELKPQQQKIILYLKNVDFCNLDSWGTSDIIELLLQIIQHKGFYSENLEWILIKDVQICASISNLDLAKQKISPRYICTNGYIKIKDPSEKNFRLIINNKLHSALKFVKNKLEVEYIEEFLMKIYNDIKEKFENGPNFYNFTSKTMIKVIENLSTYSEENFKEAILTEINTSVRHRLCNFDDIEIFDDILQRNLGNELRSVKQDLYFVPRNLSSPVISYISSEEWAEMIRKSITLCNNETYLINGPVMDELLLQTSTLVRILHRSNAHLTLISSPGSRTLDSIYLAATILSSKIYFPQGVKNYSITEFYNDLKQVMQVSALEDIHTIFLIDQCWLTYLPDIMKPIEAVLEGSEILDLFGDDLESIASPLKSTAQLEDYQDSITSYFFQRVNKNMHIVILLDSESDRLNNLFKDYSALYRNNELLWILKPKQETLIDLPKKYLDNMAKDNNRPISIPKYFSKLIESNFLRKPLIRLNQLMQSFYYIYQMFHKENDEEKTTLLIGVEKLAEAYRVVDDLKANAIKQEEALAEKRKLANDALEMISLTMRNANDQKSDLLDLKKKTEESSRKLQDRQKAIALELSEVEPVLKEASAAVSQIKTEALSEIRSLRAPPEIIRDILEGVLRLMGTRDTSWNSMKSFLAKRGVKEDIKSLDPARIAPEHCEAVENLLATKSDSFNIKNAKRASVAAAPLASWVIANVKYSKVIQSIKPLELEQKQLQRNLSVAESEMKSLSSGLNDVDARVKELSNQLNVYTQEAAVLEIKLQEASSTLNAAEVLVQNLSSEYVTWNNQLQQIEKDKELITDMAFWISLIINYASDLQFEEKKKYLEEISENISIDPLNIIDKLVSDQEQIIWESMGLITHTQSLENVAVLIKILTLPYGSCPIPFVIDPSETTLKWIQSYLLGMEKNIEITSQNSSKITYSAELAVRFGKILIIQDCESINPPLLQIIFGRVYSKFNKKMIQIGNKLVDLNENFRLLFFTKLNNVNFPLEINAFVTKIYFTVTSRGLTDQLLSKLILIKKPELEEKRIELLKTEGNLLKQRKELEIKLLKELSEAQGDILKNLKLIQTLNDVKESSIKIDDSLEKSAELKSSLLNEYNSFRDFCLNIANFFVELDKIFNIKVGTFLNLFEESLKFYDTVDFNKIHKHLLKLTYQYMCRSTPKENHLILGLQMCKSAYPNLITSNEWGLFVTNFSNLSEFANQNVEVPEWINKETKSKLLSLSSNLPELYNSLKLQNEAQWRTYQFSEEIIAPPVELNQFSKLLVTQIFHPEFLIPYISDFIFNTIGIKPELISKVTIEQLNVESVNNRFIIMIAESGSDPSIEIKDYSLRKFNKDNYAEISIGRGKEKDMLNEIKNLSKNGKWICIKNIHLMPHMIDEFEREIISEETGENFRLWLICDSTKKLPETILNKYLTVFYESPNGVKPKIEKLIRQLDISHKSTKISPKSIKLHVIFFILNSVVHARLKYIPQGWSKHYEFGDADAKSGIDILKLFEQMIINHSNRIDWKIIQGLLKIITYGGRISNSNDLEILEIILIEFFNDTSISNRWSPLKFNINIPNLEKIEDYYEIIRKFPDSDKPEYFGVSPLSDNFRNLKYCKRILKTLRSYYYKETDQDGEIESLDKRLKPLLTLWKKLAHSTTIEKTANSISTGEFTVWQNFLISELKLAALIIKEVHNTLVQIHLVLKHLKNSNNQIRDSVVDKLSGNQTPHAWQKLWSGPKTASDYIKALITRGIEAEKRCHNNFDINFCNEINLSTVFNVSTFFSILKLSTATNLNKPSSDLVLYSNQMANTDSNILVKISSVKVDGAVFYSGKLIIFNKTNQVDSSTPDFYISYVEKNKLKKNQTGVLCLPLYSNISRDIFICKLNVSTNEDENDILLSGAALYVPDI